MNCPGVLAYVRFLDQVFAYADTVDAFLNDEELLAHWAKYICILVSGFLEVALREILGQYVDAQCSDPNVANFVRKVLDGASNPNVDKLLRVTGQFSVEWKAQLRARLTEEQAAAMNNVITNRHAIAHGRDCDLTYARIKIDYTHVLAAVEHLESVCGS